MTMPEAPAPAAHEPQTEPPPAAGAHDVATDRRATAQRIYGQTCGARRCPEPYFGFVLPLDGSEPTFACGRVPEVVAACIAREAGKTDSPAITGVFRVYDWAMIAPPEA